MNCENGIIKYCDELWKCNIDKVIDYCKGHQVYIYGAGLFGKFVKWALSDKGINVEKFIVTELKDNEQEIDGIPVAVASNENLKDKKIIIAVADNKKIIDYLHEQRISDFIAFKVEARFPVVKEDKECLRSEHNLSTMQDGMIRIRITNRCPGKCDFCGILNWAEEDRNLDMDPRWYMEYMKPLYKKIKTILVTGGDAFYAKKSYDFMKMISDEYKHITIFTESNGLTFSDKFQQLACDNLMITHFSLNASNAETYAKSCWTACGGEIAYEKCVENVRNYIELLKRKNRVEFAPDISMVINSRNAEDVVEFIRMALRMETSHVTFFFDYQENDMSGEYFADPDLMRRVLLQLLEIEALLKDKFYIQFRLWVPTKELAIAEEIFQKESMSEIYAKYSELYEMAKCRSVEEEHGRRNSMRREHGKRELTLDEDYSLTVRTKQVGGRTVCAAPYEVMDFYPNGRLDFCGWHAPTLYFPKYIKDNGIDWDDIINSCAFRMYRENMFNGDFSGCMKCCPVINEVGRR